MNEALLAALLTKLATRENIDMLVELVVGLIAEMVRQGELTPEQATARKQKMLAAFGQDHWQPRG